MTQPDPNPNELNSISAYALFQNRRYSDIPRLTEFNQLLDYILERGDSDRDVVE